MENTDQPKYVLKNSILWTIFGILFFVFVIWFTVHFEYNLFANIVTSEKLSWEIPFFAWVDITILTIITICILNYSRIEIEILPQYFRHKNDIIPWQQISKIKITQYNNELNQRISEINISLKNRIVSFKKDVLRILILFPIILLLLLILSLLIIKVKDIGVENLIYYIFDSTNESSKNSLGSKSFFEIFDNFDTLQAAIPLVFIPIALAIWGCVRPFFKRKSILLYFDNLEYVYKFIIPSIKYYANIYNIPLDYKEENKNKK